ncbi:MAG: hypothetical protein H6536_02210 [Bacteroidales bacterium]|nr:hypothetical protein [Bacteroidales bacterium]
MKKNILAVAVLSAAALALTSFGMVAKNEKAVKLSDVSASLAQYEGKQGQDFVSNTIIYKEVGKDSYDKIFKESAVIYATIVQTNGTIDGINTGTIPTDGEFATANVTFALKDIPTMKDRIAELQKQLQNLKPKDDFKGLEMKKAPVAADGINMAQKQLTEASNLLPTIAKNLEEIAKKVIKK